MKHSIKSTILAIGGFALLSFGVIMLIVGIGMTIESGSRHADKGPSIALSSIIFFTPAVIMIFFAYRNRQRRIRLQSISGIVSSYRRITLSDIAGKTGIPEAEVIELLSEILTMGLVKGNFDRTTGEFFTLESREQEVQFKYCPSCGAQLDRVYLTGETVKCSHCGTSMTR